MPAVRGLLLDLDGVVHVDGRAVPGAVDALRRLDRPRLFVTNTTSRPRRAIVEGLAALGIEADEEDVWCPPVAAARHLLRCARGPVALFAPASIACELPGLELLGPDATGGAKHVVIGDLGDAWDAATLNRAFRLLAADPETELIALGATRYWRAADGLRLDVGAWTAALEAATGRRALVLGKPEAAFFAEAAARLGLQPADCAMVGDDVLTDVGGAQSAGLLGLLVRTGKFRAQDLEGPVRPDAVLESIADLPAWLAARERR